MRSKACPRCGWEPGGASCAHCGASADAPLQPPEAFHGGLLRGALAVPRALLEIVQDGECLRWSLAPIGITLLMTFLLFSTAFLGLGMLIPHLGALLPEGLRFMGEGLLGLVLAAGLFMLLPSVGMLLLVTVGSVVAGPFLDPLGARVERRELGMKALPEPGDGLLGGLRYALPEALKLLGLKLGLMIPCLPLLLLPVLGPVLFTFLVATLNTLDFFDLPMGRRRLGLGQKLRMLARHPGPLLGFASSLYFMLLLPLLGLLLLPAGAIAATRLYLAIPWKDPEQLPPLAAGSAVPTP